MQKKKKKPNEDVEKIYLVSGEFKVYEPCLCQIIKRLECKTSNEILRKMQAPVERRNDPHNYALLKLTPPIPKTVYGTELDLSYVIIGGRGDSLYPIKRWPVNVFLIILNNPIDPTKDSFDDSVAKLLDICFLHNSYEQAKESMPTKQMPKSRRS